MSLLMSLRGIKKSYGDLDVLKDVNLDISYGEKIGLVGNNGAGKTSLANIIYGSLEYDAGTITYHKSNLGTEYLLQSADCATKLDDYHQGDEAQGKGEFTRVSRYLGLGKNQVWEETRRDGLSGGEKTKLALAAIWSKTPELLILDEPTNNLDMQGIEWLIAELNVYTGAVLIISHDRYFLDQTVERIMEVEAGVINDYMGNYSFYRTEKQRLYESQLHQYTSQVKEQQKIAQNIEQLKDWSAQAHKESRHKAAINQGKKEYYRAKAKKRDQAVKSKLKRLEKMQTEGLERPQAEPVIKFSYIESEKRGRRVIEANNISKCFGARKLFDNSSFFIKNGEKIGLYGPNGCGKTTLLRIILGLEDYDQGDLFVSPSARIAYIGQDSSDLDLEQNALEVINAKAGKQRTQAITLLANMGLNEAMLKRPLKDLSPGEQTRIKMARSILENPQLLIMDEPGNHLDLLSREQLETTLCDYDGTILLVSHDRYMLERVCNVMLVFNNLKIQRIEGGFQDYLQKWQVDDKSGNSHGETNCQEDKLLIETRISFWLGELNRYQAGSEGYRQADSELKQLMRKQYLLNR